MKQLQVLSKRNDGFVSVLFLGYLLYISSLVSISVTNINYRAKTMLNLEVLNRQQLAEFEQIELFKIKLAQEKEQREKTNEEQLDEKDDEVENEIDYEYTSGIEQITIYNPNYAELIIRYNPDSLEIIDYESFRELQEIN